MWHTSAEDLVGWPRRKSKGAPLGQSLGPATARSSSSASSRKRFSTSCPSSTCTHQIHKCQPTLLLSSHRGEGHVSACSP